MPGRTTRRCLYADEFRIVSAIGDDCVPRTKGWDAVVVETLRLLGTGLCYGNDLLQGEDLPTVCFMTSDIVRTLGYMSPPALTHMYCDNFWLELGRGLDRIRYLAEVVIEHLHPSKGKSASDAVYEESDALMERDRLAFEDYMRHGFDADIARVKTMVAQGSSGSSDAQLDLRDRRASGTRTIDGRDVPILITCRDRVEALGLLVSWLERAGYRRLVFVDNASTFGPLLSYYQDTPHQVLRLNRNVGHLAVWDAHVLEEIGHRGPYVVTDCDVVPADDAPPDAVDHFADLLFRYSDVDKVGFGLRIDDLPEAYQFRSEVFDWESKFWESEVEPGVFRADIDTTFALYRSTVSGGSYRALRTGPPYVARHLPWYVDSSHLSEEDEYYREHALPTVGNWHHAQLPEALREKIESRREERAGGGEQASTSSAGGDPGAQHDPRGLAESELFELATLDISSQLAAERKARQAAEKELSAIRGTLSYRWMMPARMLRAKMRKNTP